jgi:thioredoxin-dependent peroxiredoxin
VQEIKYDQQRNRSENEPAVQGDTDLKISKAWGMLPAAANGDALKRTASDNQTVRNVFVIGPDKKIKLILVYPMTTGRNFDEVLRVIDSLQLTAKHKVATSVNWERGEDVIIAGSVSDEDAKKTYPGGLEGSEALYPHCATTAIVRADTNLPHPRGEGRSVPGPG